MNGVEDGLVHLGGVLDLLKFSSDRFVSIGTDTCRSLHAYETGWQAGLSQKLQHLDNRIVATQLFGKIPKVRGQANSLYWLSVPHCTWLLLQERKIVLELVLHAISLKEEGVAGDLLAPVPYGYV